MTVPEPAVQPNDEPANERRDRHRRQVEALRGLDPDDPRYAKYAKKLGQELAEYAFATFMSLYRQGKLHETVYRKTQATGAPALPLAPSSWTDIDYRSIVGMAVVRSVEPFMESAVRGGGWDPDDKASLSTFFLGKCYYSYRDDYRRALERETVAATRLLYYGDRTIEFEDGGLVLRSPSPGPEHVVITRDWFSRLFAEAPSERGPVIVFLQSEGMEIGNIAEYLDMTPRDVENELRRLRRAMRRRAN